MIKHLNIGFEPKVNLMCTYKVPLRFSSSFYSSQGGQCIPCKGRLSETLKTKGLCCLLEIKDQVIFFI